MKLHPTVTFDKGKYSGSAKMLSSIEWTEGNGVIIEPTLHKDHKKGGIIPFTYPVRGGSFREMLGSMDI